VSCGIRVDAGFLGWFASFLGSFAREKNDVDVVCIVGESELGVRVNWAGFGLEKWAGNLIRTDGLQ